MTLYLVALGVPIGVGLAALLAQYGWFPVEVRGLAKLRNERDALRKHNADLTLALEVKSDVLAICVAREWNIRTQYDDFISTRFSLHPLGSLSDDDINRMAKTWRVGSHSGKTLAEAWARACAAWEAEEKIKAQFAEDKAP